MEASEERRQEYLDQIKDIPKENLVYIDESGIETSTSRSRGWGKKNEKLKSKKSGKYYERINIIAGYVNKENIAPMLFNGNCNTKVFEAWVGQCLIKELKPGQVVIMDNASFHKSRKTRELIESIGCQIIFLPPYSPDFNPIEQFWANMKRWLEYNSSDFQQFYLAISYFFKHSIST